MPLKNNNNSNSFTVKAAVGFGVAAAVAVFTARALLKSKKKKKITRIIDTIEEFHKGTIHMKNPNKVEDIVCELIKGGAAKLQVISDFDDTITRTHLNGHKCSSSYGIVDNSPLLPDESREKLRLLKNKYYKIEIDPNMSINEKIPFMVDWYAQTHSVLMNTGIKKMDFTRMVSSSNSMLRKGVDTALDMLNKQNVPFLVFSAGLGDLIEEIMRHHGVIYPNIKFISNYMQFDSEGNIVGFKGELIHMYNKNQCSIDNSDYFQHLKGRSNIILLGDSIGDLDMCKGYTDPSAVLRIGFLNDEIQDRLPQYLENYDIVLTDDQTMDILVGILKRIL